ncbi:MAG TPA: transcription antitermination factor NusB, partial [Reyranella sp.]|nr:transcription antitermination factor NusB [Reyranella sp.]
MDDPLASRRAALEVLTSCLDKGQPLDDALAQHEGFAALVPRDRAFVRLLLATVLRRLGELDEVLRGMIERPLDGANAPAWTILRLGAAQLLFLGTPAHAAVDTTVRLVEGVGLPHLKGLANAVLRRLDREGAAVLGGRDAGRLNTPRWLWESWVATYGEEVTRAIAAAHLIEAPLDITSRSETDFWAGQLDAAVLPTGSLRRTAGGYIADLPGFAEGAWWVQDAAATLPARLLGDVAGKRVADLCAAPGGTLVYAVCSLQEDEGPARIDALLARERRARLVPIVAAELPGLAEAASPAGDVRTLPSMWAERGGI